MILITCSSKTGNCFHTLLEVRVVVTLKAGEGDYIDWEVNFLQVWQHSIS